MRRVNKPWGYEIIWAETDRYLGKVLHIMASKRLSLQYHEFKDETIMVHKGMLRLEVGSKEAELQSIILNEGDSYRIPPGAIHRMSGVTDCQVLEVSSPEINDVVRLVDDFGRHEPVA